MATVPRIERTVSTNALPGVRMTAAETEISTGAALEGAKMRRAEVLGESYGRSLEQLGHVVQAEAIKQREAADQTALFAYDNELSQWEAKALYDPQSGALMKRGQDAMTVPETVGAEFEKAANEIEKRVQPGRQARAWAELRARRRANLELVLRRHTAQEVERYQVGELNSFVKNRTQSAIANAEDQRRAEEDIAAAVDALQTQGPRLGLGPEQLQEQIQGVKSAAYVGAIDQLLANKKSAAAKAYYEEHKGDILGPERARIEKAIENGTIREEAQRETARILGEHPDDLEAQREAAKKIENAEVQDEVVSRLEHEDAVRTRIADDKKLERNKRFANLIDQGGDIYEDPEWNNLSTPERDALMAYADRKTRKKPVDGHVASATWYQQIRMATSDDPKEREKFYSPSQNNLLALYDKLDESELKQLMDLQVTGAERISKEQRALLVNAATQNRIVDEAILSMGMDPTPQQPGLTATGKQKVIDQEATNRVLAFRRTVRDAVMALELKQGKQATDEQVQLVVDQLRKPIGSTRIKKSIFGDTYRPQYKFEIDDVSKVPQDQRSQISDALRRRGLPVTSQAVIELYIRHQGEAFAEKPTVTLTK
jgi:hypothetical protein